MIQYLAARLVGTDKITFSLAGEKTNRLIVQRVIDEVDQLLEI